MILEPQTATIYEMGGHMVDAQGEQIKSYGTRKLRLFGGTIPDVRRWAPLPMVEVDCAHAAWPGSDLQEFSVLSLSVSTSSGMKSNVHTRQKCLSRCRPA